ncbi:anion transporter [Phormidium tenue]|uniref:Anion transporter n=1 Tax=Phormidium tenue NIES-30 TaxID=549789 RepID=A0A1U7J9X1_9CYAN|nr:anion transporter [Phormidium tenue]MBD2230702.1 anion transporter [Phormidium tenue FACHB-1052]OKH50543.1 anion transporter [Phormidium tenue NIES-30]
MTLTLNWLTLGQGLVLALSYLGLALGYVPGLRMNRATIALVSAAVLVALGTLSLEAAWAAIDANTIVFLLSMMVVNAYLSYAGFFALALVQLLRLTRSPLGLLVLLTLGTGALSAVFLNDTLALVSTPLTLQLTRALKLNPVPYLLAIAGATNTGSLATLSGNPQNILVGSFSDIGYLAFAQALLPIAVVGLALQVGLLWLLYPEVRSLTPCPPPVLPRLRLHRPLLVKTTVVSALLLSAFIVGLPLAESAFVAAAALLITRRIKPERVLGAVDWSLLVMFSGLFILTEAVRSLQVLDAVAPWVAHPAGLLVVTAGLSNLISNVPAVLLIQGLIAPDDTQSWLLLAAGSTLAGNLTLFGSVANLITVEAAAAAGYPVTVWQHLRFGLPLTLLTLALTYVWVV